MRDAISDPPGGPTVIQLAARLDLRAAADLAERLLAATGPVRVDASGVDVLTSPAAQVLLAAQRDPDVAMRIEAPSNGFRDCLAMLGIEGAELGLGAVR